MMMGCLPWMGRGIGESMRIRRTSNGEVGNGISKVKNKICLFVGTQKGTEIACNDVTY